jgi:hypothetical protein
MTREERKAITKGKKLLAKEERAEARRDMKAFNWMVRKLKAKDALIEITDNDKTI